jgi:uncharacterized membrane protein YkgB
MDVADTHPTVAEPGSRGSDHASEPSVPYVPRRGWLARVWHRIDPLDRAIARFMRRVGIRVLRLSLGVVFVWFGALKLVGMSPAEDLVRATVYWISGDVFLPILGVWEVLIGLFLLYRPTIRLALALLFLQMPGTMLPLVLLPEVTFSSFPFGLTLEGQYIIKNLTLIAAAMVVGGTARSRSRFQGQLQ